MNANCYFFRAAIFIAEEELGSLMEVLIGISDDRIEELQIQGRWLYEKYFSSLKSITLTTLEILNDRVFPQRARTYDDWNMPPNPVRTLIFFICTLNIKCVVIDLSSVYVFCHIYIYEHGRLSVKVMNKSTTI